MNQDGIWLPILEYASLKKTSISTIRRGIKSGRLKFREENGKYLVWTKGNSAEQRSSLNDQNESLRKEVKQLREEINDLKMLLSIYENKDNDLNLTKWDVLPPLPLELEQWKIFY